MPSRLVLILAAISVQLTIFSSVTAQTIGENQCEYGSKLQATLLEYAALAEAAYKPPGLTKLFSGCPIDKLPEGNMLGREVQIKPIPTDLIRKAANRFEKKPQYFVDTETNEELISCTHDRGLPERILLSIRFVVDGRELSLLARVVVGAVATVTSREELRVVELSPDGKGISKNGNGQILGVKGTDRLEEINTSVQQLLANSCAFELAADISAHWIKEFDREHNAIVGHSLGGAVSQYAAQKVNSLHAYSFNSIGEDSAGQYKPSYSRIYSVTIEGEVLQRRFGMKQVGNVFVYKPKSNSLGELGRHRISSVQDAICRCLLGHGSFMYSQYPVP